ncbi:MAG: hypothetical protein M3164_00905 [Actinomycetota bacterium]|nr:hypothetical protein [Actinomycetota bacterium]
MSRFSAPISRLKAILLVTLIVAAGCTASLGGSGSDAERAEAVCRESNRAIGAIPRGDTISELALMAETLSVQTLDAAGKLDSLGKRPGEFGARFSTFVSDMRAAAASARQAGVAARSQDLASIEPAISRTRASYEAAQRSGSRVGLERCGRAGIELTQHMAETAPPALKAAYIAKADARCALSNRELQPVLDNPARSFEELAQQLDRQVASDEKLVRDLRAIPPPPREQAVLDDIFAGMDQIGAKNGELRDAARAGNQERLNTVLRELNVLLATVLPKLDRFGFRDCGSAGTPREQGQPRP